jgi:hypothetical protein
MPIRAKSRIAPANRGCDRAGLDENNAIELALIGGGGYAATLTNLIEVQKLKKARI